MAEVTVSVEEQFSEFLQSGATESGSLDDGTLRMYAFKGSRTIHRVRYDTVTLLMREPDRERFVAFLDHMARTLAQVLLIDNVSAREPFGVWLKQLGFKFYSSGGVTMAYKLPTK